MNYWCRTGMSLCQGGGRLSLVLSGTLLLDPSFSYPREVEIWYEGRELIIKQHPYQPFRHIGLDFGYTVEPLLKDPLK